MSNQLSLPEQTEFWSVTPQGIELRAGMPENEYRSLAEYYLGKFEESYRTHVQTMFIVGDLLAYGEREYGETYADVIDATKAFIRKSIKTLQNASWVAKSVKPHIRHENLTLAHHEAVAKLDEDQQVSYLDAAENEEWTVAELKKKIKADHPAPASSRPSRDVAVVDRADEAGITHGLEVAARYLDDHEPEEWSKDRLRLWMPHVKDLINAFAQTEEGAKACLAGASKFLASEGAQTIAKWTDTKKGKWTKALDGIPALVTALTPQPDPM